MGENFFWSLPRKFIDLYLREHECFTSWLSSSLEILRAPVTIESLSSEVLEVKGSELRLFFAQEAQVWIQLPGLVEKWEDDFDDPETFEKFKAHLPVIGYKPPPLTNLPLPALFPQIFEQPGKTVSSAELKPESHVESQPQSTYEPIIINLEDTVIDWNVQVKEEIAIEKDVQVTERPLSVIHRVKSDKINLLRWRFQAANDKKSSSEQIRPAKKKQATRDYEGRIETITDECRRLMPKPKRRSQKTSRVRWKFLKVNPLHDLSPITANARKRAGEPHLNRLRI